MRFDSNKVRWNRWQKSASMLAGTALLSACCFINPTECKAPVAGMPTKDASQKLNDFRQFQSDIGASIASQIASGDGANTAQFTVVPTDGMGIWPVGTIILPGRSINNLQDDEACKTDQPHPVALGISPGEYKVDKNATLSFGLDKAIQWLTNFAPGIDRTSTFDVSLSDLQIEMLSNAKLDKLLAAPQCAARDSSRPQLIIRGYILAKRNYLIQLTAKATLKADVKKVVNFDASYSPADYMLKLSDPDPYALLMIVSQAPGSTIGKLGATASSLQAISNETVLSAAGSNTIYLQVDEKDVADAGQGLREALAKSSYVMNNRINVEKNIERLPSSKMPNSVTVKYFTKEDRDAAEQVREVVQRQYPEAKLSYVPLPIKPGKDQVEVWLAKTR